MATLATQHILNDEEKDVLSERCLDLVFVDDVTELLCKRCGRVLIHHYVANCGHLFCRNCKRVLSLGDGWRCPECMEYITHIGEQKAEVEERVLGLMVHCLNYKYGCRQIMPLGEIPRHLKSCEDTRDANLPKLLFADTYSMEAVVNRTQMLSEEINSLKESLRILKETNDEKWKVAEETCNKQEELNAKCSTVKDTASHHEKEIERTRELYETAIERKNKHDDGNRVRDVEQMMQKIVELSEKLIATKISRMQADERYDQQMRKTDEKTSHLKQQLEQMTSKLSDAEHKKNETKATVIQKSLESDSRKIQDYQTTPGELPLVVTTKSSIPEYNILLVGESGAGKSLLVNSIPNYLKYKTLDEMQNDGRLMCLIPVKFTLANEIYEETVYEYGGRLDNERLVEGESSTVACRCYELNFVDFKIRLIDSPGIGSTDGEEQDKRNMENVLETINSYDHLHVIAIVMHADHTKMTHRVKACFNLILINLHKSAAPNIVFILTHGGNCDFEPSKFLTRFKEYVVDLQNDYSLKGLIALDKSHLYCVDNKGYRYLVTRLSEKSTHEPPPSCVAAWSKSATAIERFFQYVIQGSVNNPMDPHVVAKTMSISEARQFIKAIKPELEKRTDKTREIDQKLQSLQAEFDNLDKTEKKAKAGVVSRGYIWVCQSDDCKRSINVNGVVKDFYPQLCSEAPFFSWFFLKQCKVCSCEVNQHKKIRGREAYSETSKDKSAIGQDIAKVKKSRTEIKNEQSFMEDALKKFKKFNQAHSLLLQPNTDTDWIDPEVGDTVTLQEVKYIKDKLFNLKYHGADFSKAYEEAAANRRAHVDNHTHSVNGVFNLATTLETMFSQVKMPEPINE